MKFISKLIIYLNKNKILIILDIINYNNRNLVKDFSCIWAKIKF